MTLRTRLACRVPRNICARGPTAGVRGLGSPAVPWRFDPSPTLCRRWRRDRGPPPPSSRATSGLFSAGRRGEREKTGKEDAEKRRATRSLSSLLKLYPWKTEHLTVGKAHFRGVQRSGEVDAATAQAADGTPRPGCPCPWTSAARPRPRPAAPARAFLAPWAHLRLAPLTSAAPVPPRGAPVHCGAEQQPWPLTLHGWRLTRDTNDGSRYRQRRMGQGESTPQNTCARRGKA